MKKIFIVFVLIMNFLYSGEDNNLTVIKNAVVFSHGSGEQLYIVTDPECPFCQKLSMDKDNKFYKYKVNYILYPLSYHKESKKMINYILNASTDEERYERYINMMTKGDKSYTEVPYNEFLVEDYVAKSKKAIKILGVSRVPSIFEEEEAEFFDTSYLEL